MPMIDGQEHLPLDIDIDVEKDKPIITKKPMLYGWAAYDMMHVKGGAMNACAEVALEEARSLTGTKEDFGSRVLSRKQSNLSPTPTEEGSLRPNPCFEVAWNLFDGKTAGLNEPMVYHNRLAMAFGMRKRTNSAASPTDQRNVLLGRAGVLREGCVAGRIGCESHGRRWVRHAAPWPCLAVGPRCDRDTCEGRS